jgi:hypothetical protein
MFRRQESRGGRQGEHLRHPAADVDLREGQLPRLRQHPGHLYTTFEEPNYRAILLRGIAWSGKRPNLDEFCKPEEISALTYPKGGPQRPRIP